MDVEAVVEAFVQAWNVDDPARRDELLEATLAPDGTYTDPDTFLAGRDAIAAAIADMHVRRPGARIEIRTRIDHHDGGFRFGWATVDPGGAVLRDGVDFGHVGADGRITSVAGFFGSLG